jgi:hypothetical protein
MTTTEKSEKIEAHFNQLNSSFQKAIEEFLENVSNPTYEQKSNSANHAAGKDSSLNSPTSEPNSTPPEKVQSQKKMRLPAHDLLDLLGEVQLYSKLMEASLRRGAPEILCTHLAKELLSLSENFANTLSEFYHQPCLQPA